MKNAVRLALVLSLALANVSHCQDFTFGTDLVDGVETGRVGGGFASGYMSFAVDGNSLTAVLRNSSPDSENYGGDNSLISPFIDRFHFYVSGVSGENLRLKEWQIVGRDLAQGPVILGADSNSDRGLDDWRPSVVGQRFRFRNRRRPARAPLYNPSASGGFLNNAVYFTEAVLTATFSATIGSAELNPLIRFQSVGADRKTVKLHGTQVVNSQPEPASLAVWGVGGLLAVIVARRRRKAANR